MTVVARRVIATPARSASEAWQVIINLLAPSGESPGHQELREIAGIASSLIAEGVLKGAPCVVYGSGPRVRIYCLYGEEAITGENTSEGSLSFTPAEGRWSMSLPCPAADLEWVQEALQKRSIHVSARDLTMPVEAAPSEAEGAEAEAIVDREAFLRL